MFQTLTDIKIRLVKNDDAEKQVKLLGFASFTIDECFVIHDISIKEGSKGIFIQMPSRKIPDGKFKDIAHPINQETREKISTAILDAYKKAVKEQENNG